MMKCKYYCDESSSKEIEDSLDNLSNSVHAEILETVKDRLRNTGEVIKVCEDALDGEGQEHIANVLCFIVRDDLKHVVEMLGILSCK